MIPPVQPVAPGSLHRLGESIRRRLQGPTLTVSVEREGIRVVVLEGSKVVAWGRKTTEGHLDVDSTAPNTQLEVRSAALKQLLGELGIRRGRVVTDLPLNDSLMRHLSVPEMSRRYIDPMVTSEVLETIPLFEAEADISWRIQRNHVRQEVFAAAVPKRAMDNQILLLREAGLHPAATYSREVALACAANLTDAIIIQLEGSHVVVVVVHDGVPQFTHRAELPAPASGPHEGANAVAMAVEQASDYYETINQTADEGDVGRRLPVVLTGQLPPGELSWDVLEQRIERDKLPFNPPLTYPADFPVAEYPANLGLAQADWYRGMARGSLPTHRGISVNLLPERHRPRRLPWRPVGSFLLLLLLGLAAVGVVTPQVEAMESNAGQLSARLTAVERAERLQFLAQARIAKTEGELKNIEQQAQDLESHRELRQTEVQDLLAGMRTISQDALPRGAQISDLARQKDGFSFTGTAFSYDDVIQFKTSLLDSGRFSEVRVQLIQVQSPTRVNFQMNVSAPPIDTVGEAPAAAQR